MKFKYEIQVVYNDGSTNPTSDPIFNHLSKAKQVVRHLVQAYKHYEKRRPAKVQIVETDTKGGDWNRVVFTTEVK